MKAIFGQVLLVIVLGIIALALFSMYGLFNATIFQTSKMTDKAINYVSQNYYYQLYKACKENPMIENKSVCDEYLKLSIEATEQYKEREKTYDIFGNPILWLLTGSIAVVIAILLRIGGIQVKPDVNKLLKR